MTDCGVNFQALDQIVPATMERFVWTWERDEPSGNGCAFLNPETSRWSIDQNCETKRPHACVSFQGHNQNWILGSSSTFSSPICPSGYEFGIPVHGYFNKQLSQLANGQQIWINFRS